MASITRESNGRRTIQFVGADGKRRSIRLGKCDQRTAEAVKVKVEALVASSITGHALDGDTARWVNRLDQTMANKLAAVGLTAKRESATLGPFLEAYIGGRSDVKQGSVFNYRQTQESLVQFFRADKRLADITPGDADEFRVFLKNEGYAEATISRRVKYARQFFKVAMRRRLLLENAFADVKGGAQENRERDYFVTRAETQKVIDACPDVQWRVLFALSRFGGLRCPSEHLALRWGDIDWEKQRITVRSCKTERYAGKESRVIPLFPELRPYLEEAFEQAPEGTEYVVWRYRDTNANLRTQLERIIGRAGLKPWPKLFQNLRASRETELAEAFPVQVVTEWIGNSPRVAQRHYLQTTEEHYQRAVKAVAEAVQNPVQQPAENARTEPHGELETCGIAEDCEPSRNPANGGVRLAGFEPATYGLGNRCSIP